MEDYKNIRISLDADVIVDELIQKFCFPTRVSAMRFALSYALRDFRNEIDFENLDSVYEKNGTNLNTGTIDNQDMIFKTLITILFPNCDTPYKYARVAIIYGLFKIKEKMESNPTFLLTDII